MFKQGSKIDMGNGSEVRFWEDHWLGGEPLCNRFPALYRFSSSKGSSVQNSCNNEGGNLVWNLGITRRLGDVEIEEFTTLIVELQNFIMSDELDRFGQQLGL
ncbi:hypothetical protein BVC80_457g1 [Macleaya cordata]|uniref:Uncharacterized protein n=1 Tax=Macleaya cordata TaxID=56857 RepID=A0A200PYB7_MACCD|nr:hypothetical protein BVC80_457g1 [Macleaya cordata]